jgi:hypothetical protein
LNFLCEMMCGLSEQNKGQAVVLKELMPRSPGIKLQAVDPRVCMPLLSSLGTGFLDLCWGRAGLETEHSSAHRSRAGFIQFFTTGKRGPPLWPHLPRPCTMSSCCGCDLGEELPLCEPQFPNLWNANDGWTLGSCW